MCRTLRRSSSPVSSLQRCLLHLFPLCSAVFFTCFRSAALSSSHVSSLQRCLLHLFPFCSAGIQEEEEEDGNVQPDSQEEDQRAASEDHAGDVHRDPAVCRGPPGLCLRTPHPHKHSLLETRALRKDRSWFDCQKTVPLFLWPPKQRALLRPLTGLPRVWTVLESAWMKSFINPRP